MVAGGEAAPLAIIPEARGKPFKRTLYVLRGDVEKLGASDGCVACTNPILGNMATETLQSTSTRRMQELVEKDAGGRVKLEMGRLRQPDEVVAEQPPAGVRAAGESQETSRCSAPSTEVRHESMKVEVGSEYEPQTPPPMTLIHEWTDMKDLLMMMLQLPLDGRGHRQGRTRDRRV